MQVLGHTGAGHTEPGLNSRISAMLGQKVVADMAKWTVGCAEIARIRIINYAVPRGICDCDLSQALVYLRCQQIMLYQYEAGIESGEHDSAPSDHGHINTAHRGVMVGVDLEGEGVPRLQPQCASPDHRLTLCVRHDPAMRHIA